MKKNLIPAAIAAIVFAASCTPVQKSRTTKTLDISGAGVMHMPVVADLSVREMKTTGTATAATAAYLENAKQQAVADAIENGNADVLVEPVYKTMTVGSRVTVTVTGYPAQYRNFRNATPGDTSVLKIGTMQKHDSTERSGPPMQKKNPAGAVLGTLLGVGLIVLLIALI